VTILGAGSCAVDADQAGDGNYDPAPQVTRSFTITLADQTIDFPAIPDFTWLGGSEALSATASSGLAVSYSIVSGPCSLSSGVLFADHAGSCVVAADQAGDSKHSAAPQVTQPATILKAAQTINVTTHAPSSAPSGAASQSPPPGVARATPSPSRATGPARTPAPPSR